MLRFCFSSSHTWSTCSSSFRIKVGDSLILMVHIRLMTRAAKSICCSLGSLESQLLQCGRRYLLRMISVAASGEVSESSCMSDFCLFIFPFLSCFYHPVYQAGWSPHLVKELAYTKTRGYLLSRGFSMFLTG